MFKGWNRYHTLYFILTAILFAVSSFTLCNVPMIGVDQDRYVDLPIWLETIGFVLTFTLFFIVILIALIKKHYRFKRNTMILFLTLTIVGVVGILILPAEVKIAGAVQGDGIAYITNQIKVISVFQYLLVIINFFVIFNFLPSTTDGVQLTNMLAFLFMSIVSFFCFYSYFTETSKYINAIIDFTKFDFKVNAVYLFFPNPNAYSVELFFAMVGASLLHNRTGKWWWILPFAFFALNIPFTASRVTIIATIVYLIGYWIYRAIKTFKTHKILNIVSISIAGVALISLAVYCTISEIDHGGFTSFLNGFLKDLSTLAGRIRNWNAAIAVYKSTDWRVGAGYNTFAIMQSAYFGHTGHLLNFPCHNGFLEFLGSGGIFMLALALCLYGLLIYRIIRLIKYDSTNGIQCLLLFVVSFIFSTFESGRIVMPTGLEYIVFSLFVWVTVNSQYKKLVPSLKLKRKVLAQ